MAAPREIVVIDDDAAACRLMARIFEGGGYRVHTAPSVSEGLLTIGRHRPHLVVLDLFLNNGQANGFDFLQNRLRMPALRSVPVLVVSSIQKQELIRKALSMGAEAYAGKPIEARALLQRARKLLRETDPAPAYRFAPEAERPATGIVLGRIVRVNEEGFLLEAPAKLAERGVVRIQSPLLRGWGGADCVFRATSPSARVGDSGHFLTTVNVMGVSVAAPAPDASAAAATEKGKETA